MKDIVMAVRSLLVLLWPRRQSVFVELMSERRRKIEHPHEARRGGHTRAV